jgi:hypothetical protein
MRRTGERRPRVGERACAPESEGRRHDADIRPSCVTTVGPFVVALRITGQMWTPGSTSCLFPPEAPPNFHLLVVVP